MDCKSNIEQIEKRNNPKITKEDLIFAVHTIKNSDPQPSMGWQRLIRKLELAGSKKVILSGMLFAETNTQLLEKVIRSTKGLKSKRQRKENSMNRVVLRAMKMHGKTNGEYAGCAGLTKARLIATGKFDVKTTKQFSKPLIRLLQKTSKR